MNHFKRIQELPADLRAYTQTVLANKSLEREKEEQKELGKFPKPSRG